MEVEGNGSFYGPSNYGDFSPENSNEYLHCSTQNYNYSYGSVPTSCGAEFAGTNMLSPEIGNENISPPINYQTSPYDTVHTNSSSWDHCPFSYPPMSANMHMGHFGTTTYNPFSARHSGHVIMQSGKPKRRRVATVAQRRAANIRERRRMFNLNEAFDELRKIVPTFAYEKRLSRIETLRLAITYISFMADVVNGKDPKEVKLTSLKPTGWFSLKKLAESVNLHGIPPPMS